jgi:hypothetical protein
MIKDSEQKGSTGTERARGTRIEQRDQLQEHEDEEGPRVKLASQRT